VSPAAAEEEIRGSALRRSAMNVRDYGLAGRVIVVTDGSRGLAAAGGASTT
jgi:hypothetical protein